MKNYEANIFQFDVISERVKKIQKDEELPLNYTKCLMFLYLQQAFGLDRIEILDSIVDGPDDFGIDAIYIEQEGEETVVHLIQSKFYENRIKFERPFEQNALTKMKEAITDLITHPDSMPDFANAMLRSKIETIHQLGADNVRYEITFLGNCFPPTKVARTSFKEFIQKFNKFKETFKVSYVHLNELTDLLPNVKEEKVDAEIRLDGDVMIQDLGNVRTLTGRAPARELVRLIEENGSLLFEKNVRGYLNTRSNVVNQKILQSSSNVDSQLFFVLNNGLTIVCDSYTATTNISSPNVKMKGMQIVNGGQTSNTLFQAHKKHILKPDVSVLIKIIQTDQLEIVQKITEATNSQTQVRSRDLHSNDPIQKQIEDSLEAKGYFYEARKNKYQGIKPTAQRVDADRAAQTYFAFYMQQPAEAKTYKSKLFSSYYEVIFNPDEFNVDDYLFAYLLFSKLISLRSKFEDKYGFIRDAELTSLALIRDLIDDRSKFLTDDMKIEKNYQKILIATQKIVSEDMRLLGDKFEKRRLFIDKKTFGRVKEKLIS